MVSLSEAFGVHTYYIGILLQPVICIASIIIPCYIS